MDWSGFPTLNSLRAFSTLAETLSFSQAASVLNVTHAAVSQQVKSLEDRMGLALVVRRGRKITLTPEGKSLARDLVKGFSAIHSGVGDLTGAIATRSVQVTMTPALAVSYLMPRIANFHNEHPGITLMLNPTGDIMELTPNGIDIAIRFCDGLVPGMEVTPFLLCDMVIVGARELVGKQKLTDPAKLAAFPWLQELGTNEVAEWMERRGVTPDNPLHITHMPGSLIMDAVRRGHGLTYTARSFVEREIQSGELIELYSENDSGGYYLVTRPGVLRPAVLSFINWLKHQENLPR